MIAGLTLVVTLGSSSGRVLDSDEAVKLGSTDG